jgi:hypothetical protein
MKCPACDSNSLPDNPQFGILSCGQCKSRLLYSAEGVKEAAVPLGKVIKRTHQPMKRVIIKREGPQLETKVRCVACAGPILSTLHYTGTVIQGLAFMRRDSTRILQTELGSIETWDRTYPLLKTDNITEKKSIPFLKREKGALCDKCAGNIDVVEIPQKDGTVRREPLIKVDPIAGFAGSSVLPATETIKPSIEPPQHKISSSTASKVLHQIGVKQHDHWLEVGRRRNRRK